jgi:hypothetical protein
MDRGYAEEHMMVILQQREYIGKATALIRLDFGLLAPGWGDTGRSVVCFVESPLVICRFSNDMEKSICLFLLAFHSRMLRSALVIPLNRRDGSTIRESGSTCTDFQAHGSSHWRIDIQPSGPPDPAHRSRRRNALTIANDAFWRVFSTH